MNEVEAQLAQLRRQLAALEHTLETVQRRLARLEGEGPRTSEPEPAALELGPVMPRAVDAGGLVGLFGRLLVVLGGAFLIRAFSESPTLPTALGASVGLAYAAWWLWRCDRAAARGARLDAAFHGFASALVVFPLVFEVTARFGAFPVWLGALVVVISFAVWLRVAVRRELPELAWTITLLASGVCIGLIQATHDLVPATLALFGLAALGEILSLSARWFGLRWPLALGANAAVALVVMLSVREAGLPEAYVPFSATTAIVLELLLAAMYLASVATRTLIRQRRISVFAMVQVPAALLLGLGGAAWTAQRAGASAAAVGGLALLLGAVSYGVAARFVERGVLGGRNFHFYASLAAALVLAGSATLLEAGALAAAWFALALVAAWSARRVERASIAFQAAVYLACGLAAAGSLRVVVDGLVRPAHVVWLPLSGVAGAGALCAAAAFLLLCREPRGLAWRLARASVGVLASAALAGLLARLLIGLVAGEPGPEADAGLVAALRTGVLAIAALALAAGRRWRYLRDLAFLVTPLLVLGGLKLAVEDLRVGRPVTLFLSLVLYGGALALAPRLQRRGAPESAPERDAG